MGYSVDFRKCALPYELVLIPPINIVHALMVGNRGISFANHEHSKDLLDVALLIEFAVCLIISLLGTTYQLQPNFELPTTLLALFLCLLIETSAHELESFFIVSRDRDTEASIQAFQLEIDCFRFDPAYQRLRLMKDISQGLSTQ